MNFDFSHWDDAALATFVAALVAGGVALLTLIVTVIVGIVSSSKINNLTRREQWWTRWSWTIEKSLSQHRYEREIGQSMMDALVTRPWVTEDDKVMAKTIAAGIVKMEEAFAAAATAEAQAGHRAQGTGRDADGRAEQEAASPSASAPRRTFQSAMQGVVRRFNRERRTHD